VQPALHFGAEGEENDAVFGWKCRLYKKILREASNK